MNAQNYRLGFYVLALVLITTLLGPGIPLRQTPALAFEGEVLQSSVFDPLAPTYDIAATISYQGKLLESGTPVSGDRSMTFRLFSDSSGGSALWTEGPKTVTVSNGLFTVSLGDTTALDVSGFSQKRWLEIQVGAVTLPRQILQGAPYALSLAPGAGVFGSSGSSIFSSHNTNLGPGVKGSSSSGHGVLAESSGSGLGGAALYARNTSDSGISLWAYNSSPSNTNATLALSNDGSGDLLKGFGGDGGEDEFRFKNDGTFQNKQPSYIFVPGSDAFLYGNGAALISYGNYSWVDPSTTGTKTVFVSATLPSVLYGQGVEVEEVRIYYATTDSASYIDYTSVDVMNNLGIYAQMVGDSLNHDSTAVSSYGLIPTSYQFFSADLGFLSVKLDLYFANASHIIQIIGVRIKLRHHPLY